MIVLSPSPALDVTYLVGSVVAGEIHRPREVLRAAGGKGLNLARAAAVIGERVTVVAPLGGRIGELIVDLATGAGLDLDAVPIATEARTCVSVIPETGAPTEFYEPAAPLSHAEARALADHLGDLPAAGWSALAGSLPEFAGLAAALLARRALGDRVAVDSSGPQLAALIEAVRPDLLKVNTAEARETLGADGDAAALAYALQAQTDGTVVVTDGAAGAVAVDATGAWRAAPDPRPGRFAIGSGDSFFAGLLVALAVGAALPDALRSASAAGSANTRMPGAGIFDRAEYDAAYSRIEVHSL